jgi:hypothetical protein
MTGFRSTYSEGLLLVDAESAIRGHWQVDTTQVGTQYGTTQIGMLQFGTTRVGTPPPSSVSAYNHFPIARKRCMSIQGLSPNLQDMIPIPY